MDYKYQTSVDDLRVQYSLTTYDGNNNKDSQASFLEDFSAVSDEIDNLTNHADGYDYAMAVSSGIISGLIDSFIVGEWDFARGKKQANINVNNKVTQFAKKQPDYLLYCQFALEGKGGPRTKPKDPDRLQTAIEFLEWKFPLPGDAPWLKKGYEWYKDENHHGSEIADKKISSKSHHLDDLSHHPTLVGLFACIVAQYTKVGTYVNSDNQVIKIPFDVDDDGTIEGKTPVAKIGAGFINWCFNVAKNRYGHLMSDLGGSKSTAGGGMGLPGSVLSTLKELSCLPCFKDPEFSKKLAQAYQKGIGTNKGQVDLGLFNCLFAGADSKVDYRTEEAIKLELKRQTLPVAINEVIVRSFYFIRHLTTELKEKGSVEAIDFKKVIPLNNRTIVRMLTISTGTLTAVDLADAAIRAASKSGGNGAVFATQVVLRVNFVGVGRFAMAVGADVYMESKKGRLELAMVCGEVAKTAIETQNIIEKTKSETDKTADKLRELKVLSKEIDDFKF